MRNVYNRHFYRFMELKAIRIVDREIFFLLPILYPFSLQRVRFHYLLNNVHMERTK